MRMSTPRSLIAGLSVGALLAFGSAAAAERPAMPKLSLSGETRGAAAVSALGRNLPAVAAHYRMSPERLQEILGKDSSARIDRAGRLFFVERGVANATTATAPTVAEAAPYDLSQTFLLASKPGASKVLYLDFDGYSTSGTAWNSGAAINALPFDTDGLPSSFSAAEQEAIQKVWQRVAEDYAPFDVNVTTADPGTAAIRRTSSTDANYGSRVVITKNTFYNCSCGGVAYVGTYDYASSSTPDYYQPAWVFYDALGNGFEKYVAEAAAHEAGHNLGLSHDGRTSPVEGYYGGHGSGDTSWAPIMGVGYSRNLSQWSQGEYTYANNLEDDLVVIGQNGLTPRSDDAGNSIAAATPLAGSASNGSVVVSRDGLINNRFDADVYAFVTGSGTVNLSIAPAALGPNLDINADLFDSAGNMVATSNPADTLGATISATLGAGTYYLRIDGVGKGDPTTGYSDYGSIGQYRISGSYVDSGALAPVASFTASSTSGSAPLPLSFNAGGSSDADGAIVGYSWNFGDGSTASGITASKTYSSAGSYSVVLTVTDDSGLTSTSSQTITVTAPPLQALSVSSVAVTATPLRNGYRCSAQVSIVNAASTAPVASASVTGAWSGTVTGTVSGVTGSNGVATLSSGNTKKRGTCTYTVNGVTASGYSYSSPTPKPAGSVSY